MQKNSNNIFSQIWDVSYGQKLSVKSSWKNNAEILIQYFVRCSSACKKRDATFEVKDITRVWRYHHISKFYCARYRKTRKATSYRSARKLLLDKSGNIKMPNGFSGKKNLQKRPKNKTVTITIEFYIFQIV